ncbi:MAG: YciI family protein [Dokdonella sp.]|nr:YciI family protein [Dokdonella sp.]
MQFLLLIYNEDALLEALPDGEAEAMMRSCLAHADELREEGHLLESQQLEPPAAAKAVRIRGGKLTVLDGPFAETKEYLGGFNLIEAADYEEAVRIAATFPWARTGCVEVRPVRDIDAVRRRVGAGGGAKP